DTVFPGEIATRQPFKVEGDRVFGRGVADMKGSLAALYFALQDLDIAVLSKLKILICLNSDEELGSPWSKPWLVKYAQQSACVLAIKSGRPEGGLICERRGAATYQIDFYGKSAHAGIALAQGASAITELAHWTLAINGQVDMATGMTMNVGRIEGGGASNMVPDHACALVGLRFWHDEQAQQINSRLNFMANNPFVNGCHVTVTPLTFRPAMKPNSDTKSLMNVVAKACDVLAMDCDWQRANDASDTNLTAAAGVPSLDGFGPIGGHSHSQQEYLQLSSVAPRIALIQQVLTILAER
ncbi:MAG: M20/M25/M40 family metallo-hydrolase, partial [Shewanella sp.]